MKLNLVIFLIALPVVLSSQAAAKVISVEPSISCKTSKMSPKKVFCGIANALKQLRPGDTLKLKPGVYHQPLDLRQAAGYANANHLGVNVPRTTIKGPKQGTAVIDGSKLVRHWRYVANGTWVRLHWIINTQQGFINGHRLQQIGGTIWSGYPENPLSPLKQISVPGGIWPGRIAGREASLQVDQYYYDKQRKRLYVRLPNGVNPNHERISFSVLPYLLFSQGWDRLSVEDLRFRHSNTSAKSQAAAVTLSGDYISVSNLHVQATDSTGIAVAGNHNHIEESSVIGSGRLGFNIRGEHLLLIGDVANDNNTRGFNKYWEAGGFKFVGNGGARFSILKHLVALRNKGDGIWFDWKNHNVHLSDSVSAYNSGFGIHVEVSHNFWILGNKVYGNGQRGISLASSQNIFVIGNLVANNGLGGIISLNEHRGSGTRPGGILVCGNQLAWNHGISVGLPYPLDNSKSYQNIFILGGRRPEFSLGNGIGLSGLSPWRSRYGQGQGSRKIDVKVPLEIRKQLKAQKLINWRDLLRKLGVPTIANVQTCKT